MAAPEPIVDVDVDGDAGADLDVVDRAWSRYAERIRAAGELITGPDFPADPRLRAEGYRYVARLTAQAHYLFVEFADTARPALFARGGDVFAYGATNVDNNYSRCMLDPQGTYRITGDVRGLRDLLFSVHEGEFVFGKPGVLAEAALEDLKIGDEGQLDLVIGGEPRLTNWISLATDATYLSVRQFVMDWENDPIAELHIERVDPVGPVENLTAVSLAAALERAASWVEANVRAWNKYALAARARTPVNRFAAPHFAEGGVNNMVHGGTIWQLDPDHALVIELDPAGAPSWSIQNYVLPWLQPLDFIHRVTSFNPTQAHVDEDGRLCLVLAHQDPGIQNWLDTSGLPEGLCSARWIGATTPPAISARVVAVADLAAALPTSTPSFSAEARAAQITARRRGAERRFRR